MMTESAVKPMLPAKIDLAAISNIVNALNKAVAPVLSKDIHDIQDDIIKRNEGTKNKLLEVKELTKKHAELKVEKSMILKRLKIVSMLQEMYGTYSTNDKLRKDMLAIINSLDSYNDKRLDAQIAKLQNIMSK